MQPDHRRTWLVFQRVGDARRGGAAQPERRRRQAAEFKETTPGDALAAQHFVKGLGHWNVPPLVLLPSRLGATQSMCHSRDVNDLSNGIKHLGYAWHIARTNHMVTMNPRWKPTFHFLAIAPLARHTTRHRQDRKS